MLLTLPLGQAAQAAPGDLDPSFDADGRVLTDLDGFDRAFAVIAEPDGKLVAAGAAFVNGDDDFSLARYNPDGRLDASFNGDGRVRTSFGSSSSDNIFALERQPDGMLVAAGFSTLTGNGDFALARYTPDGELDTSFDIDGRLLTDFGGADAASAVVVQPNDGKIVAAGSSVFGNRSVFSLARYNPDGGLDAGFDIDGLRFFGFTDANTQSFALAVQPDGRLVAAGAVFNPIADFLLVRFNSDGTPDPSFGGGGFRVEDFGGSDGANALVVQADGKIVAAGTSNDLGNGDFALARFASDGSLDTSFGVNGHVLVDFGGSDVVSALVMQPDGRILAAGFSIIGTDIDLAVARFENDGSLDTSFGSGGLLRTSFGAPSLDGAFALALQPDGKVVAAGTSNAGGDLDFALARYAVNDDPLPRRRFCNRREVTIIGTPRNDQVRGTNGDDVILGLGGNDTIRGLEGNDTLCGGAGRDMLIGGPGRDRLLGEGGRDMLFGEAGNDRLDGGRGRNRCDGGSDRNRFRNCGGTRPPPPPPPPPPVRVAPGCASGVSSTPTSLCGPS